MFSWGTAPRRFAAWPLSRPAGWLLAVTAAALLAVAFPIGVADARRPGGGYDETYPDQGKWASGLTAAWSAARTPLRWLRQSSRSFQSLMRLLAERSAGSETPLPVVPRRHRKEAVEEPEEPPRRSVDGGEAGAGRDRGTGGARVKEWQR